MEERHPLLRRHLSAAGWEAHGEPTLEQIGELLDRIQTDYERAEADREEFEKTLELSARETRKMHEELLEEHRRLRTVLESLSDAVFYVDSRGGVLFLNPVAANLLDCPREDVIGGDLVAILNVYDEHGEPYPLGQTIETGAAPDVLLVGKPGGERVPVAARVSTIVRDDRQHGYVVVLQDLSEVKAAQAQLHEARVAMEAAREADLAKSNFLANMSHEIRTPMNGVVGMADLLLETDLSDEQCEYASTVRSSAQSLLAILNDILDFSKIEAGMLEMEPIPFDLRHSVEEVAELLAPTAGKKNLELIIRYDPAAPRHLVGDPGRIRQVVMNLVGNAIKFTREGHVLIDVEKVEASETQACLRVSIQDTGIGIANSTLPHVFRKFTQADDSTTRRFGGTGLGLAISKQLVELMGGEIGVDSVVDAGSTFWFEATFKIHRAGPAPLRAEELDGVRVAVIESSETGRRTLVEQLEHWNMRVEGLESGGEALRRLRQARSEDDPFRIAILSSQLKGMDAETLGDLVKSDPDLRTTDLVLLAPVGEAGDAKRLDRIGFSGYLVRPVREEALKDTLEVVWGGRKHGAAQGLVTRHRLNDSRILRGPLSRETEPAAAARGGRVLLADDDGVNQRVARAMLEGFGMEVDIVSDGRAAADSHARNRYDAIFLDCEMPGLDGPAVARLVRERERDGDVRVPIIAVTAGDPDTDRRRCEEAGMDDFLGKPYGRDAFRDVLDRWVQARAADDAG